MLLSRTRKEIKTIESFYKEAGLDREIENMYQKNPAYEALSKKDRVMLKKKTKADQSLKMQVKTTSDRLQSDVSDQHLKQSSHSSISPSIVVKPSPQSTLPLTRIINRISILQVVESKIVNGCYGHTTVIFKRPIIQGNYYIQFKLLKPNLNETKAKIRSPPAVRMGICPTGYSKNVPLGQDLSICYKGSNGKLVFKGEEHEAGDSSKEGDILGLCLSFTPPYKYLDPEQPWEGSFISITKNGVQMARYSSIQQCFYCPAFSLFNYASVEVRYEGDSFDYCPEGYSAYGNIFSQPIGYENLKNSAPFAFLKLEEK